MILVADSGSTKTSWAVAGTDFLIDTEGLNPHFTTDETFAKVCADVRQHLQLSTSNLQLFFYGAGCGDKRQRERVSALLSQGFGTDHIEVSTDMLGACRAVSGNAESLVGILGTGSNACHYDGRTILHQAVSTGFILGDHGSANHVGRLLLQDYLDGTMPTALRDTFRQQHPEAATELINRVYHQPNANRFLASLAPFAAEQTGEAYCRDIIAQALEAWYVHQLAPLVEKSGCRRLCVVGGFGTAVNPLLQQLCHSHGITLAGTLSSPIANLAAYHAA